MTLSPLAKDTIIREAENREIEKIRFSMVPIQYPPKRQPTEFEKSCTIAEIAKGELK